MRTATHNGVETVRPLSTPRCAGLVIAGMLVGCALFSPAVAQEPAAIEPERLPEAQPPAAAEQEPDLQETEPSIEERAPVHTLPAELRAIAGVRQGMDDLQLLEVAQSALNTRQLDDAETILRYLVLQNPALLQAHSLLAYTCELQMQAFSDPTTGNPARAESYQKEAVKYYLLAGNLALKYGLYAGAKGLFERVMRYDPTNAQMKLGLARYNAAVDRGMLAIEHYNEYLKSPEGRTDSQAWLELGRIFHRSGYTGQAVTTLQKAIELNPENPETHYELALTYLDDKRIDQAREVARTAMQKGATTPNYHKYINLYARILLTENQFDEATVQAKKAIQLAQDQLNRNPDDVNLLRAVVAYHDTLARILKAKINLAPDETGLRIELARSIADQSSFSRLLNLHAALRALPRLDGDNRSNIELLELAAELQYAVQKYPDAAATCKRLLELDGNNAKAKAILQRLPAELQATAKSKSGADKETAAATP